jgi:hypothetical protein
MSSGEALIQLPHSQFYTVSEASLVLTGSKMVLSVQDASDNNI